MKDKPSILVVDDDPNISRLEQLYLEKEGCEVRVAADGRQAVEEFRRLPPDLILLDVMLPGMDGYEVLKTVRKSGNIPVIMVTARGEHRHDVPDRNSVGQRLHELPRIREERDAVHA